MERFEAIVAVHVGAGYHSPKKEELYKEICRNACSQAMHALRAGASAVNAATAAVVCLEDSEWTNAGYGSNLTLDGTVECDAGLMDGQSLIFGAVGAVEGVHNPILIARNLIETQNQGLMELKRIPPSLLVGKGAKEWAASHDIPIVPADSLITEHSHSIFLKYRNKLDEMMKPPAKKQKVMKSPTSDGLSSGNSVRDENGYSGLQSSKNDSNGAGCTTLDTVGVTCMDINGNVASAVSSGGILLKQSGRVGQAAVYGCGCWAENREDGSACAITTSGCGEHLIRTSLAKECVQLLDGKNVLMAEQLAQIFKDKFLDSPFLRQVQSKLAGAVVLCRNKSGFSEILWAHTTNSLCLAYMRASDAVSTAVVSRLPHNQTDGSSFLVQGVKAS